MTRRRMRTGGSATVLRLGMSVLAASTAFIGGWGLLLPRSFYDAFPGAGGGWVALLPPYNEHLVRDVGGFSLAFAALFVWAAITGERNVTRAALGAWLVSAVPHLLFHVAHLEGFTPADAAAQTVSLAFVVVLPVALLVVSARGGKA